MKEKYSIAYHLIFVIRKISDKIKDERHDFEGFLDLKLIYIPNSEIKDGCFFNFVCEIHFLDINDGLNLDLSLLKEGENNIKIIYWRL